MQATLTDLNGMIGALYDAAIDRADMVGVGEMIAGQFNAPSSSLMRIDSMPTRVAWHGLDPTGSDAYHEHYYKLDPWLAAGMTIPIGHATACDSVVAYGDYVESAFYRDYMRDQGDLTHCLGLMFGAEDRLYSMTMLRTRSEGAFDARDEELLETILPHLRRALVTRTRLDTLTRERERLEQLAATEQATLLLVNPALGVRWMSGPALPAIPGLSLGTDALGRSSLEIAQPRPMAALRRAVTEATRDRHRISGCVWMGQELLFVDPLPAPDGAEPLCVVRVPDRAAKSRKAIAHAAALFDLTRAEATLCAHLLGGGSIESHAETAGVSPWTTRTHLRNVFAKTGADRQASLVLLLAQLGG